MRKVYFRGTYFLVPFLKSEKLQNFSGVSAEEKNQLSETIKEITKTDSYAERQIILEKYAKDIDDSDPAKAFYKSTLGMIINLRG